MLNLNLVKSLGLTLRMGNAEEEKKIKQNHEKTIRQIKKWSIVRDMNLILQRISG